MQYEICDLFQKCYGKDAYNAVSLFLKLDDYDKDVVMKMIDSLSSNEKYSAKKESQNA